MMDLAKKFVKVVRLAPKEEVDEYAMRCLRSKYISYKRSPEAGKEKILARFFLYVDAKPYETFYDAVVAVKEPTEIFIKFHDHTKEGWRFDYPTSKIKITGGGMAAIEHFHRRGGITATYDKVAKKVLAGVRIWVEHGYIPQSIKTYSREGEEKKWPPLMQVKEFWAFVREHGAVPFKIRLCTYTNDYRITYHLDLTQNAQLSDFKSNLVAEGAIKKVDPLYYLYLDRAMSSPLIPSLQKKILEIVFEGKGMTAGDIAHIFNITEKMAANHLKGLVRRGLIKAEGKAPLQYFVADLKALKKSKGVITE